MYDLGLRIKEIRTQRGYTQKVLARKINKSISAVCSYETNAQMPPLDVLLSIASTLGVSLDQLVGFDTSDTISVKSLSIQQKELVTMIIAEFTSPSSNGHELTSQQVHIIQQLILSFSGYSENIVKHNI